MLTHGTGALKKWSLKKYILTQRYMTHKFLHYLMLVAKAEIVRKEKHLIFTLTLLAYLHTF